VDVETVPPNIVGVCLDVDAVVVVDVKTCKTTGDGGWYMVPQVKVDFLFILFNRRIP